MRVGRSRKANSFRNCEFNDAIARVKLIHRFAPAGGGKFNGQIARANEVESLANDRFNLRARSMSVNLDEIEVGETVDQAGRRDLANAPKIIGIDCVDLAIVELRSSLRNGVEHLIRPLEKVHGAEDKIEFVPMLLHPASPHSGMERIVIQLDPSAKRYV